MGYWIVDDHRRFDDIDELCDFLFDVDNYEDDEAVREYIDGYNDSITIGGVEFRASEIVEGLDESLWNEMYSDWQNSQSDCDQDEYYGTLESMEDGDEEWINDFNVKYYNDPEEEEEDEDGHSSVKDYYDEDVETVDEKEEAVIKSLIDHFQKLI